MTGLPDLRGLLAALVEHEVDFVVVGGVAVVAHGALRATADVDIVPNPEPANLDRLVLAVSALGARLPLSGERPFDPPRDAPALRRRANATLDTPLGGLDIVQDVPGLPPYDALRAEAVSTDVLGVPLFVCSLHHLLAMKRRAGRPIDLADLDALDGPV